MADRNIVDPADSSGRRPSDVEWFIVIRVVDEGDEFIIHSLSKKFSTLERVNAVYPAIKAQHPDAVIGGGRTCFNPLNPYYTSARTHFVRSLL